MTHKDVYDKLMRAWEPKSDKMLIITREEFELMREHLQEKSHWLRLYQDMEHDKPFTYRGQKVIVVD